MPIIARNHRQDAWQPLKDWPSDTYVQWGGRGVVLRADDKGGSYSTAFFEAMPAGGGFIRGEGKSIEEAEADAFSRFEKEAACRPHRWGRRGYTNGGAKCLRCGSFRTAFKPIYEIGAWRAPLSATELSLLQMGGTRQRADDAPDVNRRRRHLYLRARLAGLTIPNAGDETDEDDFEQICRVAVARWFASRLPEMTSPEERPKSSLMGEVFDRMHLRSLMRDAIELGFLPPEMAPA